MRHLEENEHERTDLFPCRREKMKPPLGGKRSYEEGRLTVNERGKTNLTSGCS
jgi:hypothetical protein